MILILGEVIEIEILIEIVIDEILSNVSGMGLDDVVENVDFDVFVSPCTNIRFYAKGNDVFDHIHGRCDFGTECRGNERVLSFFQR